MEVIEILWYGFALLVVLLAALALRKRVEKKVKKQEKKKYLEEQVELHDGGILLDDPPGWQQEYEAHQIMERNKYIDPD